MVLFPLATVIVVYDRLALLVNPYGGDWAYRGR